MATTRVASRRSNARLAKYPDAPAIERARALAYRADLAIRLDRPELAQASLDEIRALDLD